MPFIDALPFTEDGNNTILSENFQAGFKCFIIFRQVFNPFTGTVYRQYLQCRQQPDVKRFFKNITSCQRPYRLLKQGIDDNRIKKRVGMIACQQQGSFYFQQFGFINDNLPAKETDSDAYDYFKRLVEQFFLFLP